MDYLPIQEISARIANSNYSERNPFYAKASGVSSAPKKEVAVEEPSEVSAVSVPLIRTLTPEERRILDRLLKTDQEFQAHQQANVSKSKLAVSDESLGQISTNTEGPPHTVAGDEQMPFPVGAKPDKDSEKARPVGKQTDLTAIKLPRVDSAVNRSPTEPVGSRSAPVGILGPQSTENQTDKTDGSARETISEEQPLIEKAEQDSSKNLGEQTENLAKSLEKAEEKRQAYLQDPIISWLLGLDKDKDVGIRKSSELPQLGPPLERDKKSRFSANA